MGVEARERMSGSAHRAQAPRNGTAMRVLVVEPVSGLARCAGTDAIAKTVETTLVAPVEPGDLVLVHSGVALLRLDAEWSP
jgi:hydrogenase maturation factor